MQTKRHKRRKDDLLMHILCLQDEIQDVRQRARFVAAELRIALKLAEKL